MRQIVQTSQFKQDLKKVKLSGRYKIDDLLIIVEQLARDESLAEKYKNHDLTGNWKNHKECHIKADWLLIYQLIDDKLILIRTGSHSELF
ncbi:MAG: type II toxin-antitoxin system YafQ family toxin [Methylococcaceae bacterium]